MEKFTRSLLNEFVIDKPSAKMVADNINVIEFIEKQVAEFGLEKHNAFLEKVFHGKQVSAEHFFKVLNRVEAAIARKAGAKVVAKATKTAKTVAKATKKADNVVAKATKQASEKVAKATKQADKQTSKQVAKATKQASKPNAQKESVLSIENLQTEIAKLVKVYNQNAKDGKKVSITMSYIVAKIQ